MLIFALKFFVRFLGELKKTKSPFEINWPLRDTTKSDYFPVLNCLLNSFGLWSEANLSFSLFSSESKWKYFFEQNERMRNCVKFFKIIGFNWEKRTNLRLVWFASYYLDWKIYNSRICFTIHTVILEYFNMNSSF